MNKTKKILSIILISLLIISTVFTFCKKIGLCASSENSSGVNSYPLPFGLSSGYGFTSEQEQLLSTLDFDTLIATCESVRSVDYDSVCLIDYTSSSVYQLGFYNSSWLITLDSDVLTTSSVCNIGSGSSQITATVLFNNGNVDWWYGNNWGQSIYIGSHLTSQPNGSYTLNSNEFISGYPIYSEVDTFSTGVGFEVFTYGSGGGDFTGHSKGGVLVNYADSSDLLENSSEIPPLDLPSSATDFQSLWNNMKCFFQRSFTNFNAWLLTIGDYLGRILEALENFFDTAIDRLEGFLSTLFETFYGWFFVWLNDLIGDILDNTDDIVTDVHGHYEWDLNYWTESGSSNNNFWDYFDEHMDDFVGRLWNNLPDIMKQPFRIFSWFYTHGLNNNEFDFMTLIHYLFDFDKTTAYNSFASNKYGDFLLDVKDFSTDFISALTGVTESDRVFFTISLGNHFGVSISDIVIDFDWYSQVKNTFLPWLMAFLYVSVVWLFIKRLPDIIKGVAGDISSFEDNLPNNEPFIHDTLSGGVLTHSVTFKRGNSSFTETSRKNVRW